MGKTRDRSMVFIAALAAGIMLTAAGCSLSLEWPGSGISAASAGSGSSGSSGSGSSGSVSTSRDPGVSGQDEAAIRNSAAGLLDGLPLLENKAVYAGDRDGDVICIYLTVRKGAEGSGSNRREYSFDDLVSYNGRPDGTGDPGSIAASGAGAAAGIIDNESEPFCEVIFQEGPEGSRPLPGYFGYGEMNVNARMETRGDLSNEEPRSFRIRLYARAGTWRGVKVINLNKQLNDLSRMKNKLGFDAVEKLDNIAGLRTSFVRLYIKDMTGAEPDSGYNDYGLFTYMEQPNKEYLRSRGLNDEGNIYKAQDFDFSRYPDVIRDVGDPLYNKSLFEEIISIREGTSHKALIGMLDALNAPLAGFDDLVGKYFNRENVVTYCALSILYGNNAAARDDYMIYSPVDSSTWYLIPYNINNIFEQGSGARADSPPENASGIPVLMENVLLRKFLASEGSLEALKAEIDRLYKLVGPEFVRRQTDIYRQAIMKVIYSVRELSLLPKSSEYVIPYIESFPGIVENNRNNFIESLKMPYPPYITLCVRKGGSTGETLSAADNGEEAGIRVEWETGRNGGDMKYDILIAYDPEFSNIAMTVKQVEGSSVLIREPINGTVFVKVTAVDGWADGSNASSALARNCANVYTDEFGDRHYGMCRID